MPFSCDLYSIVYILPGLLLLLHDLRLRIGHKTALPPRSSMMHAPREGGATRLSVPRVLIAPQQLRLNTFHHGIGGQLGCFSPSASCPRERRTILAARVHAQYADGYLPSVRRARGVG